MARIEKSERPQEAERDQRLSWTPSFPMKTFIYMKETENRAIAEEEETIYEYIYVYIRLGKINILIKGIFLYWF